MTEKIFDLIVIGGGPAGYVCSIKASHLGMSVACIEKRNSLGGTCLNEGCIPSKALLNSSYLYYQANNSFKKIGIDIDGCSLNLKNMMDNKNNIVNDLSNGINFLFKKNKIEKFTGVGKIVSANGDVKEVSISGEKIIKGKNIVIATGSTSAEVPGIKFDEKNILSSRGALELKQVPSSIVIVGGGAIGLEMASIWNRLGSKTTIIEYSDRIAMSTDSEISDQLLKSLKKQGIEFYLSSKVDKIEENNDRNLIINFIKEGKKIEITAEKILISIGRRPYSYDIGVDLKRTAHGYIKVNSNFETNINGIYAIGDTIQGPMLAHKAEEDGIAVAEILSGKNHHIGWIPSVIYTHPEIASVGKTEQEIKSINIDYRVSKSNFSANSRARTNNDSEGFVKVIVDKLDTILGVHIIGAHASTIIAEAVLGMEYGASAEDIARTCHSHPDLNESFKEAAMGAFSKQIHG